MVTQTDEKLKGPLYYPAGKQKFQFFPYTPSNDLKFFVERYWTVHWDLCGQPPYTTEHLPDPSIHLIIEDYKAVLLGVARNRFSRLYVRRVSQAERA